MKLNSDKPIIGWTTTAVIAVAILGGVIGGAVVLSNQSHDKAHKIALVQRAGDETPTTQAPVSVSAPSGTTGQPSVSGTTGASPAPAQQNVTPTTQAPAVSGPTGTVTPTTTPQPTHWCAGSEAADQAAPPWPGSRPADVYNITACNDPDGSFYVGQLENGVSTTSVAYRIS